MAGRLTDEERGPFGAWCRNNRVQRGWTVDDLARAAHAAGWARVSAGSINQVESGRKPPDTLRAALEAIFGSASPGAVTTVDYGRLVSFDDTVAELRAQVDALTRLVTDLQSRNEEMQRHHEDALAALGVALARLEPAAPSQPGAPRRDQGRPGAEGPSGRGTAGP